MTMKRNKTESRTVLFKIRGTSAEPIDSPHQYTLGRKLTQSRNLLAQLMAKHFLEDPRLRGEEVPPGFSIITANDLRIRSMNNRRLDHL
jgi:hypothetical protein